MENKILLAFTSIAVLAFSVLIFQALIEIRHEEEKPVVDLAVCILSARNNTHLRSSIRQSWLKDIEQINSQDAKSWSVIPKFIVGLQSCDIHPDNRVSPYSCKRWNLSMPADPPGELLMFSSLNGRLHSNKRKIVSSVSIKVMHAITLKRLGIVEFFPFERIPQTAQVALYDSVSEEEIGRARFSSSSKGNNLHGYYYKSFEQLYLPKVGNPIQLDDGRGKFCKYYQ